MEARIALGSLVVFAGVLTAGLFVTQVNGDEDAPTALVESGPGAFVAQVPVANPSPQPIADVTRMDSDSDWDDDDREHHDWDDDDDEWDEGHERDDDDDDHDDDDRYEREDREDDDD